MSSHLIPPPPVARWQGTPEASFVGTPSGSPGLTRLRGAGFLLHRRVPSKAGSYLGSTGPSATDGELSTLLAVPVAHRGVLLATRRPTVGNPGRQGSRGPLQVTVASIRATSRQQVAMPHPHPRRSRSPPSSSSAWLAQEAPARPADGLRGVEADVPPGEIRLPSASGEGSLHRPHQVLEEDAVHGEVDHVPDRGWFQWSSSGTPGA